MNTRVIFLTLVLVFGGSAQLHSELTFEQLDRILAEGRIPSLTNEEKHQAIDILNKSRGAFSASPDTLERYLFLLGDRKTHDEVVAKFRKEASEGSSRADWTGELLAKLPDAETVTTIADLLWSEAKGPVGGDIGDMRADSSTAHVIVPILSNCREIPPEVAVWARELDQRLELDWVPIMRDWWKKNEQAFRERRYKDAVPGESIPPPPPLPEDAAVVPTPAPSSRPVEPAPLAAPAVVIADASTPSSAFLWTGAGVALALLVGLVVFWKRRV